MDLRSPARRHASLIGVWHEKLTLTVDGKTPYTNETDGAFDPVRSGGFSTSAVK